jgi:periplasmic copper chaperone A
MIAAFSFALSAQAFAEEATRIGDLRILDAWARASHDVSNRSAVYMSLETAGEQPDRLLAAETSAAETAELRTYWLEGCFAHRPPVEAIELSSGARTVLDPGGLHIMLSGLQRKLVDGETIALSLRFEKAGTVRIEVPVRDQDRQPSQVRQVGKMTD